MGGLLGNVDVGSFVRLLGVVNRLWNAESSHVLLLQLEIVDDSVQISKDLLIIASSAPCFARAFI